jgi:hypothetical protein
LNANYSRSKHQETMNKGNTVQFEIAFTQYDANVKKQKENKEEALKHFLEEDASILDSQDFMYYAEITGKNTSWLRKNANYSKDESMKKMIASFIGHELDEDDLCAMDL